MCQMKYILLLVLVLMSGCASKDIQEGVYPTVLTEQQLYMPAAKNNFVQAAYKKYLTDRQELGQMNINSNAALLREPCEIDDQLANDFLFSGLNQDSRKKLRILDIGPVVSSQRTWGGAAGKETKVEVISETDLAINVYSEPGRCPGDVDSGELSLLITAAAENGLAGESMELIVKGQFVNGRPDGMVFLIRQIESLLLTSDLTFAYQAYRKGDLYASVEFKEMKLLRASGTRTFDKFELKIAERKGKNLNYKIYKNGLLEKSYSTTRKGVMHGLYTENGRNTCGKLVCLYNGRPAAMEKCGD